MIAINTNIFDMKVIQEVYHNDIFLADLEREIKEKLKGKIHIVVKELLQAWFCDDSGVPNRTKIIEYLLSQSPEQYIVSFYQKAAEKIEGNGSFGKVLEVWPAPIEKALKTNDRLQRKRLITEVITPECLCMFDGITKADLDAKPKQNTLWSSKDRLKLVKLVHEREYKKLLTPFEDIFDYDKFSDRFRAELLGAMKVTVCPYCNRQFITMCEETDESKATADIDHYFCKDIYPFLALSLYNFIPSCQICNSRFKLAKDFYRYPHVNPYRQAFSDDCVFKIKNLKGVIDDTDPEYGLVNRTDDVAIKNSIETFHLNGVYKSHKDYVKELIMKAKLYNESQITEYLQNFSELFGSTDDLMQLLYGTYLEPEDAGLRPLSKLTQDILKDLGVELQFKKLESEGD